VYLDFYKFREFPFAISCDEKFFFQSSVHAEALANMMYTVQQRKGMVLVTGEVGAGKTFVGNMLGSRLGAGCTTVFMNNPPQSPKQLLRSLAMRLGISIRSGADKLVLQDEVEQQLLRMHARGRLVALIIDESQDMTAASLEELRLLWNWEQNSQRLVQIVLIGQPELRQILQQPRWEPLRQRIVLSYHLKHLTADDTERYIRHRIIVAGLEGCSAQFAPDATAEIFAATNGIPRIINVLCDNALLVGYARGARCIDRAIVNEVVRDMTCWGLRTPQAPPAQAAPTS
jgi:general secretion pathway protein A